MNRKVTVVGGAGNVGATVARGVAEKQLADVVVIDIADQKAAGVALDLLEACPIYGSDSRVMGTGDYADTADSDIVVITSGMPRKPGMSRDDLLNVNYKIMQQVTEQVVKHSPNCLIIVVSNPLDAMAQAVYKLSKFPRERVTGIPITDLMDKATIDRISARTAGGGLEITQLVGTSAWYAPGASVVEMVEAILLDKHKILPCSVFLQGEYGVRDVFVGVPVKLGARGLEKIIEIKLTSEEDAAFKKSAAAVKELVEVIKV